MTEQGRLWRNKPDMALGVTKYGLFRPFSAYNDLAGLFRHNLVCNDKKIGYNRIWPLSVLKFVTLHFNFFN